MTKLMNVLGYEKLANVLHLAYDQSARGKGKQRHANNKPFLQQPIMEIGRMVGTGYASGQIMKKIQEAHNMAERGEYDAAKTEALGAIVYAAAFYQLVDEKNLARDATLSSIQSDFPTKTAQYTEDSLAQALSGSL